MSQEHSQTATKRSRLLLALDRMIESVQEEIGQNDPGNHSTIGQLTGELKGLMAARGYAELEAERCEVGEDEIKRFRVGDILFNDEQAKMFCDLAQKGLRAETRTSDRCEKCPSPKEGCIFPRCGEISREALEKAVIKAALDLFGATNSAAFKLPVQNTTPPLFVTCGEEVSLTPSATTRSGDADTIAAKDLKIECLENALRAFVKAESDWRDTKSGMPAGTFDDPLNDAYVQAQEALIAEFIVKDGEVVRRG